MAWMPLVLIVLALIAEVFFLPSALAAWVGLKFRIPAAGKWRVACSARLHDGDAVPYGIAGAGGASPRWSEHYADKANAVEWAWAMNARASVLGSVLAMVIAIQFGLNVTLSCGAAAYLLALLLLPALRPSCLE